MVMEKVIYLFGAGASAGTVNSKFGFIDKSTVPLVGELVKRMNEQIEFLESMFRPEEKELASSALSNSKILIKDVLDVYVRDLSELALQSSFHYSIDTFARRLYLSSENKQSEINKLKVLFSTFLHIEQVNNGVDVRYDAFFSAILEKGEPVSKIPKHFSFFSWNYDFQFEKSLLRVTDADERSFPLVYNNMASNNSKENESFVCKLNGTASYTPRGTTADLLSLLIYNEVPTLVDNKLAIVSGLVEYFVAQKSNFILHSNMLKFSWEDMVDTKKLIEKTSPLTQDATNLVVIGYSFPILNSSIDRHLLNSFAKLSRVYIQCPEQDYPDILQRFHRAFQNHPNVATINIYNISNLNMFFIPNQIEI